MTKSPRHRPRHRSQLPLHPRPLDGGDEDEDKIRERIKRERYPPSIIDRWLSLKSSSSGDNLTPREDDKEVVCTVFVEYKKHPEVDEGFDDGGVYTLYLSVATPPSPSTYHSDSSDSSFPSATSSYIQHTQQTQQTPTQPIPLAKYDGSNTNLSAPTWTTFNLSPSCRLVFVEKRKVVEAVLRSASVATEGVREGDMVVVSRLAALNLKS